MIAIVAAEPEITEKRRLFCRPATLLNFEMMSVGTARFLKVTAFLPTKVRDQKKVFVFAAKKLEADRVHMAVFPEDFRYEELFKEHGISSLTDFELYPKIASKIVLFAGKDITGKDENRLSIAIYANRQSLDVRRAVIDLGKNAGRIRLLGKANDRNLRSILMHSFGVSAVYGSPPDDEETDVLLLFDLPEEETLDRNPSKITVNLSGKETGRINEVKKVNIRLPESLSADIPLNLMSNRMILAILKNGGVLEKELDVDGIVVIEQSI